MDCFHAIDRSRTGADGAGVEITVASCPDRRQWAPVCFLKRERAAEWGCGLSITRPDKKPRSC